MFIVDDPVTAEKIRAAAPPDRSLIGSPNYLAEQISAYKASGIDEFILPDFTLGATPEARRAAYDRFWDEVVPNVA